MPSKRHGANIAQASQVSVNDKDGDVQKGIVRDRWFDGHCVFTNVSGQH